MRPYPSVVFVGFDSAWTDKANAPGAICSVSYEDGRFTSFEPPRLVSSTQALDFIHAVHAAGPTLVAIDQPTIVPNATGMRPVDRIAATLVSWLGGGVQPANRGKIGMFDDAAPIWFFLAALNGTEDPERARTANEGLFYFEVFPALALASIGDAFFGRLAGPRYNPTRKKTFRLEHWHGVLRAVAADALRMGCGPLAGWCDQLGAVGRPRKADQDRLDAAICLLIAIRWRLEGPADCMLIGDLRTGYMVSPAAAVVRQRLGITAGTRT